MRTTQVIGALGALAALASSAEAQGRMGPGRGARQAAPRYDTTTVRTLTGTIARIDTLGSRAGRGVHLAIEADGRTHRVNLGPVTYLEQQPLRLAVGDRVSVRGSSVTYQGAPALIAAEVRRDERVLVLRDPAGLPAWRGQGGGRGPGMRRP